MLSEIEVKNIILEAKSQIEAIDTSSFPQGKIHRYLSKAFVAGIARKIATGFKVNEFKAKFQDFQDGKGISGEWLFDAAIVQVRKLEEADIDILLPYKIKVAVESEFDPGIRAFVDDFSKLLIVNAENKVYINGVKNKTRKEEYVSSRMELIKSIIKNQEDNCPYTICFVDHPSLWGSDNIFISIRNFQI